MLWVYLVLIEVTISCQRSTWGFYVRKIQVLINDFEMSTMQNAQKKQPMRKTLMMTWMSLLTIGSKQAVKKKFFHMKNFYEKKLQGPSTMVHPYQDWAPPYSSWTFNLTTNGVMHRFLLYYRKLYSYFVCKNIMTLNCFSDHYLFCNWMAGFSQKRFYHQTMWSQSRGRRERK